MTGGTAIGAPGERRRIIVMSPKDPERDYGGGETYVRALGRAAVRAGYEPHIFCASPRDEIERTDYGLLYRTRSPARPFRGLMTPLHHPFLVAGAFRHVRNWPGPHLIHGVSIWTGPAIALARRLRRAGEKVRVVSTAYNTYRHETRGKVDALDGDYSRFIRLQFVAELAWTRMLLHRYEGWSYRAADLVTVNYRNVERMLREEFAGGDRLTIRSIAYASESAFTREGATPPRPAVLDRLEPSDAPLIVSIARHDPRKGLNVLIHALALLRQRGIRFRACLPGGNQLVQQHRDLIERLGLGKMAICPGPVADAYAYLKHADVFVLPSFEESSGSVALLEALQAGIAPVVSNVDGLPEDVTEGESALLVPAGDPVALCDALSRLVCDAGLRARIGAGARRRFDAHFSAGRFAADLGEVYTSLGFPPSC